MFLKCLISLDFLVLKKQGYILKTLLNLLSEFCVRLRGFALSLTKVRCLGKASYKKEMKKKMIAISTPNKNLKGKLPRKTMIFSKKRQRQGDLEDSSIF